MTKSETISNLKAYLDGDTAIGNIIPLRSVLESALEYLKPSLPANVDEAAEESWQNYEYRDIDGRLYHSCYEDGFKAGAKWMAGQGETIEGTLGYGPHLQRPIIMLEGVPKFYDGHSQEVIVQIRKA